MAFSPRKQQINQHLANRQRNKKSEQTSPAQTWPARWRVWEGGMGLPHRCEFLGRGLRQREEDGSLEAEKTNKNKNKNRRCLELHQEKLKLAVSSRIRFSRFIFFSFILRF